MSNAGMTKSGSALIFVGSTVWTKRLKFNLELRRSKVINIFN